MRVLNITGSVSPDNVDASINRFDQYFRDHAVTTMIFGEHDRRVARHFERQEMDFVFLGEGMLTPQLKALRYIFANRNEFDVAHVYGSPQVFGTLPTAISNVVDIPMIIRFNGYKNPDSELKRRLTRFLEFYLLKRSDASVFISNEQKREVLQSLSIDSPESVRVIPPGIDQKWFDPASSSDASSVRSEYDIEDNDRVIGAVLNPRPIKRLDRAMDILKETRHRMDDDVYLVVIGDSDYVTNVQRYASRIGVAENVIWPGRKATDELAAWYSAFDVTILTSERESFGMSISESYLCETPCVVYDVGGMVDQVIDGETGF
jgi:glycosyltransferase involved in cell wall biosynthesis